MSEFSWNKSEKLKCNFCDKIVFASNLSRHEKSCFLNPENKRHCIVCDNPIKSKKPNSKTCSHSCSNKHYRIGPKHGNWKDSAYVTTCFHYHEKICVVCKEKNIVEVHHLDGNNKNNNPDNLIPLCPTHHKYWHSRFRKEIETVVIKYITDWKNKNNSVDVGQDHSIPWKDGN